MSPRYNGWLTHAPIGSPKIAAAKFPNRKRLLSLSGTYPWTLGCGRTMPLIWPQFPFVLSSSRLSCLLFLLQCQIHRWVVEVVAGPARVFAPFVLFSESGKRPTSLFSRVLSVQSLISLVNVLLIIGRHLGTIGCRSLQTSIAYVVLPSPPSLFRLVGLFRSPLSVSGWHLVRRLRKESFRFRGDAPVLGLDRGCRITGC